MIYISVGSQKGHAIIWMIYRAISWDSWCHSSSLLSFSCSDNCTCSQIQCLSQYFQELCNSLRPRPFLALFALSKSSAHFMWPCRCAGLSWDEALEKGPIPWFSLGFGDQEGGATSLKVSSSEIYGSFRCLGVAVRSREPVPRDWT